MSKSAPTLLSTFELERPVERGAEFRPASVFWAREDSQLCVQHFCPDGDVFYQPHSYSEYTVVICLEGELEKSQFGRTEVAGKGGVLIGNHGVAHTSGYWSRNGKRCEAVVLSIGRRLVDALAKEFSLPTAEAEHSPAFLGSLESSVIYDCAAAIVGELRATRPGQRLAIESLSSRLLVETLRAWPRNHIERMSADLTPRLPRRDFVRAYEFMRWCRKDNFRLQFLCQFLGSSEERFARLFFASTQHTPANFYNRMLLDRAQTLLRNPRLSVKEIGYELGFKTSSHFVASFRREFNVSPQEFRQVPADIKIS